jgi:hypothetical protein
VLVLRLEQSDVQGTLGRVTTAIGDDVGDVGNIDLVGQFGRKVVRELVVTCRNQAHAQQLTAKVEAVEGSLPGPSVSQKEEEPWPIPSISSSSPGATTLSGARSPPVSTARWW